VIIPTEQKLQFSSSIKDLYLLRDNIREDEVIVINGYYNNKSTKGIKSIKYNKYIAEDDKKD
jgi:hypothetical protein